MKESSQRLPKPFVCHTPAASCLQKSEMDDADADKIAIAIAIRARLEFRIRLAPVSA